MIILLLSVLAIIFILYMIFISVKFELQTINFFSGGLGSGKTNEDTKLAIKLRNRSVLLNTLLGKKPYIFFFILFFVLWQLSIIINMPLFISLAIILFGIFFTIFAFVKRNVFKKKYRIRDIYSNYPILIEKAKRKKPAIWSKPLTREHYLGKKPLTENCIMVMDEVDRMFPNQARKSDKDIEEASQQIRHWINPTIIMSSQSLGSVDIAIRRRINVVYNLSGHRKIFLKLYKVDVNRIIYMEDIIVNVNDINEIKPKRHFGWYGKRRYDSRYMKEFYNPEDTEKEMKLKWEKFTIDSKDRYIYMGNEK